MKIYKVTEEDLYNFYYTLGWSRIRSYITEIVRTMDMKLRREIRSKRTDLVCIDESNKLYKFQTIEASTRLQEYLAKYQIQVVTK